MARLLMTALAALAAAALATGSAVAKDRSSAAAGSSAPARGGSSNPNSSGGGGITFIDPAGSECDITNGCLFSGNDKSGEAISEAYVEVFPLSQLSLSLVQKFEFSGSQYSGAWMSDTPATFLSVKAGNEFVLYLLDARATSGPWSTQGLVNKRGVAHAVSHISLWSGSYASGIAPPPPQILPPTNGLLAIGLAVPEPAAWSMMVLGFGAIGALLRRRRMTTA